jgi:hypothetical protein
MIRFVVHYHFEPLIQQLFIRVSNLSLLWAVDSLGHTVGPFVKLLSDPLGYLGSVRPLFNHIRVRKTIRSIPHRYLRESSSSQCGVTHVQRVYECPVARLVVSYLLLNVDAPGGQTIQNWNPVRSSNINHAAGNLRVITWRTSMGPWTLLVIK